MVAFKKIALSENRHAHSARIAQQSIKEQFLREVEHDLAPLVKALADKYDVVPRTVTRAALRQLGIIGN